MRPIIYLSSAYKTLADYEAEPRRRIIEAVERIPRGDIKKLQGTKKPSLYRLRVGKYRIIYHIEDNAIVIARIDTRGDVYK